MFYCIKFLCTDKPAQDVWKCGTLYPAGLLPIHHSDAVQQVFWSEQTEVLGFLRATTRCLSEMIPEKASVTIFEQWGSIADVNYTWLPTSGWH